jgi:hypothetical protein
MTTVLDLSSKQLRRAAALRERIDKLEKQLASILGQPSESAATAPATEPATRPRRRRRMSKEARAKQAERMRKRWAKAKAAGKKSL